MGVTAAICQEHPKRRPQRSFPPGQGVTLPLFHVLFARQRFATPKVKTEFHSCNTRGIGGKDWYRFSKGKEEWGLWQISTTRSKVWRLI